MKTENVLYTDGHDVIVTDTSLHVHKKWYSLSGITKHGFSIVRPMRAPGFLLLVVGALLEIIGAGKLLPATWMQHWNVNGQHFNTAQVFIAVGTVVFLVGGLWVWFMRERYAVSITTAEGEKNVVISRKKEYITQIIHALNEAFFARINPGSAKSVKKEFIVSSR